MKQIFIIAISSILFISCKNSSDSTSQERTTTSEEAHNKGASDELQLNDNQKWVVNEEMKPHILQGEELIVSYTATHDTDYVRLAEKLTELNNNLIKSCTMEGSAHDELHKWLQPHLEMIDALKIASGQDKAQELIQNISTSFQTYHIFFN
ncbi:hypothetical protein [Flavobacterium tegetincola]|uniref:hypothetical protein n=1 Tax=Flavobacterium tegetincola TaxID=150172 RepID=UPI00047C2B97|nr:hypothetical protein [Flavobacterium tegetincola]